MSLCYFAHSFSDWEKQYFYTIKELREAVAPMANADQKLLDDEKVSDDALKQHRVGGRLVTRREVGRSKKCTCYFLL
jgi:ubiquitin carboxyl-terminal hydrolase 25/28